MKLDKYKLPMHVATALSTGRAQLLSLGPINLDEEAQREVFRLLVDLLNDRREMFDKISALQETVEMTTQTLDGLARKLERDTAALVGLAR